MSKEWHALAVELARLRVERMDLLTALREIAQGPHDADARILATAALWKMGEEV